MRQTLQLYPLPRFNWEPRVICIIGNRERGDRERRERGREGEERADSHSLLFDASRFCWALLVLILLDLGDKQKHIRLGEQLFIHVPNLSPEVRNDILKYPLLISHLTPLHLSHSLFCFFVFLFFFFFFNFVNHHHFTKE